MRKLALLLVLLSSLLCTRAQGPAVTSAGLPPGNWRIISGLNIQGNYDLPDHGRSNGVLLVNSHITGSLRIDGVDRLYLQGNTIGSIWMPGASATTNVTIDGNEINNGHNDCIDVNDGPVHPVNLVIENNNIHHCGIGYPGNPHFHAVYVQVPGVTVRGNHIWDANASISIRSDGTITGNTIQGVNCSGAIEYFSDHDAAPGGILTIQGNVVATVMKNCPVMYGSVRGLIIIGNGIGTSRRRVAGYNINSNFLDVMNTKADPSGVYVDIYLSSSEPTAHLFRNTLVNKIPGGKYIWPGTVGSERYDSEAHQ